MRIIVDPKRRKCEADASEEGRAPIGAERAAERVHAERREGVGGEEGEVIREQCIMRNEPDRPCHDRLGKEKLGKSEAARVRREHVAVVEVRRIGDQCVLHPAQRPDIEERVTQRIGDRRLNLRDQRPEHHDRQADIEQRNDDVPAEAPE